MTYFRYAERDVWLAVAIAAHLVRCRGKTWYRDAGDGSFSDANGGCG